jgi:hypothetical protein
VNIYKISGIVGVLIAVVGAFVNIPYGVELMAIAGIIVGVGIAVEDSVRVIVTALALPVAATALNGLPAIGPHITAIVGNIAHVVLGAALLVMLRNIYNRVKA